MPTEPNDQPRQRPSVAMTLLLMAGVVPFMGILYGLYMLLGVGMAYMGLLFLLYWAAMLRQNPADYFPSLLGGLVGIAMAWVLVALPPMIGAAGTPVATAALVVLLFCFMRSQVPLLVNNATMLYLTIATIPQIDIGHNVVTMAESLLVAALYMGGVALIVHRVMTRRHCAVADPIAS